MNILLLGGTGAMGTYLKDLLDQQGNQIYITSRSKKIGTDSIHYLEGNAHKKEFLDGVLNLHTWDAIVDFMVYNTDEFQDKVNQLLEATQQYVFLSSSRVYADSKDKIKENSPRLLDISTDSQYLTTDEYALAKAKQENILQQSSHKNWTIIRPYITYGLERLQLGVFEKEDWLYRAIQGKPIIFCKEINNKTTTLTSGLDVAKAIIKLISNPLSLSQCYHITTPHSLQWADVLTVYLDVLELHLGRRPKVTFVPLNKFLKLEVGRYQVLCDRLYNREFDNSKISQFINVNNFESPRKGLTECLNNFLQNQRFLPINKSAELKKTIASGQYTLKDLLLLSIFQIKSIIRKIIHNLH